MNTIRRAFVWLTIGLWLVGCVENRKHISKDIASTFGSDFGEKGYHYFQKVELARWREMIDTIWSQKIDLCRKLEMAAADCGDLQRRIRSIHDAELAGLNAVKDDLEKLAAADGLVVQFEFARDGVEEWGFCVVKDGKIVLRQVWGF